MTRLSFGGGLSVPRPPCLSVFFFFVIPMSEATRNLLFAGAAQSRFLLCAARIVGMTKGKE